MLTPIVATAQAADLNAALTAADSEGINLAVIDSPPHATPAASQIARQAQLVLIPVRPSAFDLAAVPAAVDIVKASKVQGAFILSACPFRAPEISEPGRLSKAMACQLRRLKLPTGWHSRVR